MFRKYKTLSALAVGISLLLSGSLFAAELTPEGRTCAITCLSTIYCKCLGPDCEHSDRCKMGGKADKVNACVRGYKSCLKDICGLDPEQRSDPVWYACIRV